MNWEEYIKLAKRTESVPAITYVGLEDWTRATRLMHAVVGLVTETQELVDSGSVKNTKEELGDCFWYLAIAYDELGWTLSTIPTIYENPLPQMMHVATELLDAVVKRHVFYGNPLDQSRIGFNLLEYTAMLMGLVHSYGVTLEEYLEANIRKLEKRYPKLRFDGEDAVNRDVEHELSHIAEDAEQATSPVVERWKELKGGVLTSYEESDKIGLTFASRPEVIKDYVLDYVGAPTEEAALAILGNELRYCQFTVVHTEVGVKVTAIPFDKGAEAPVVHEDGEAAKLIKLEEKTSRDSSD